MIKQTHIRHVFHDDVIKWKHHPRNWPFVRGIHRSPVNSSHKGQWRRALIYSLICVWINDWVNNGEAGDLRCYRAHYDVIVMFGDESFYWSRSMRTRECICLCKNVRNRTFTFAKIIALKHCGLVTSFGVNELCHHWFRYWLVACSAPSHCLNQC